MAHCVWCSTSERELLREKQTAVIHCPNSNFSLSSDVLNVRRLLQEGVKVGLGTDVSGGYSPSMLDAIRQAVIASKLVSIDNGSSSDQYNDDPQEQSLSYAEAFHLATVGSAEALGHGDTIGNFMTGKDFDALVVDPYTENSPIDESFDHVEAADVLHTFQKFLFLGDDRNINSIFVGGRQIKSSTPKLSAMKVVEATSTTPLTTGSVHRSINVMSLAAWRTSKIPTGGVEGVCREVQQMTYNATKVNTFRDSPVPAIRSTASATTNICHEMVECVWAVVSV